LRTTSHLGFPRRLQRFACLAVLVAAVAAPVAVRGQAQAAPPPASTGDAQSVTTRELSAQPGQVRKEEAEEHTIYLHTPLVASIGRALHLSVETTANLFLFINAAILFLAVGIPLARFLPKVIRKRNITLSHSLETARAATADANRRLSAVEAKLSRLDEEIAKIRAQAEEESKHDEARIKATIEEESARIVSAAEQEISVAAAQARRGLRHFAADLAIEQAARQLALTPETDRALIAEFISTASDGAAPGGKN
jgi:F-type H+-transporting ATPase subunit b